MNPLAIKAIAAAIFALSAFFGGYKLRDLSADAEVSRLKENAALERAAAVQLLSEKVSDNEKLKDQLQVQAIENRKVVDAARRDLAAVRVRLPVPASVCADYGSPDAAGGSATAASGSGVLPDQVEGQAGNAQRAMDEFIAGLKSDAEIMDGVVELCRPVMEWAKGR